MGRQSDRGSRERQEGSRRRKRTARPSIETSIEGWRVHASLAIPLPLVNIGSGTLDEVELGLNVGLRLAAATRDKGDTGDDLNLIVKLLMARRFFPTPLSDAATKLYATSRPYSYGSYLGTYKKTYGEDATDIEARVARGIDAGWQPDSSPMVGARRWYHRPDTGANPQLAELYESIVDLLLK
jgi:hypothetical protein